MQGDLGPEAYAAGLADPEVRRLESLVEVTSDLASAAPGARAARVTIRTAEGDHVAFVDAVPGDPGRPMPVDDVTGKFLR